MADIGIVGMGKLGLPVALAIEGQGHRVMGYDINPAVEEYINDREIPYTEEGIQPYLNATQIRVAHCVGDVVKNSDIVFIPVQTPHDPKFEGATRLPDERQDFDYSYLEMAVADVAAECAKLAVKKTVVAIS